MLDIKWPNFFALQFWYNIGITSVVPGSGFARFDAEEAAACVERAGSGSGEFCCRWVDGPAITPLCGAEGSRLGSGSGGGCPAEDGADESADVLIGSGESSAFSFLFLFAAGDVDVKPGRCCSSCGLAGAANLRPAVGG